jgi:hypothetical protein
MKRIILTVIAVAAFVLTAASQTVASTFVPVQGRARVITPITLSNTDAQALDFGVIARGTIDATVIVAASAAPSVNVATGDAVIVSVASVPQTAAKFTVGGESGKSYAISIPNTASINSGSNSLSITNFTCSKGATPTISSTTADNVFYVGGTLSVPSAAVAASYTGTFNVTVNYN